jgi:CheY-like chemotaxis protein
MQRRTLEKHGKKRIKKILVVDDLLYVVKFISSILKNDGYSVITALSGEEALQRFKRYNPDLVTIDQKLPDMTGFELVLKLRKLSNGQNVKIIFISGVYEKEVIESILDLGVNSFLLKPVERNKLLETIQQLFE